MDCIKVILYICRELKLKTMKYLTLEHSTNGTMPTSYDQFETAKFESVKEAKDYVKYIVDCQDVIGYNFENGSYFQVVEVTTGEYDNEYRKIGKKIFVK